MPFIRQRDGAKRIKSEAETEKRRRGDKEKACRLSRMETGGICVLP